MRSIRILILTIMLFSLGTSLILGALFVPEVREFTSNTLSINHYGIYEGRYNDILPVDETDYLLTEGNPFGGECDLFQINLKTNNKQKLVEQIFCNIIGIYENQVILMRSNFHPFINSNNDRISFGIQVLTQVQGTYHINTISNETESLNVTEDASIFINREQIFLENKHLYFPIHINFVDRNESMVGYYWFNLENNDHAFMKPDLISYNNKSFEFLNNLDKPGFTIVNNSSTLKYTFSGGKTSETEIEDDNVRRCISAQQCYLFEVDGQLGTIYTSDGDLETYVEFGKYNTTIQTTFNFILPRLVSDSMISLYSTNSLILGGGEITPDHQFIIFRENKITLFEIPTNPDNFTYPWYDYANRGSDNFYIVARNYTQDGRINNFSITRLDLGSLSFVNQVVNMEWLIMIPIFTLIITSYMLFVRKQDLHGNIELFPKN